MQLIWEGVGGHRQNKECPEIQAGASKVYDTGRWWKKKSKEAVEKKKGLPAEEAVWQEWKKQSPAGISFTVHVTALGNCSQMGHTSDLYMKSK